MDTGNMSQIFFVYDVSFCKEEDDDPKDAVLYFHPLHMCETQRYALCCQLAGIALFLKSSFTTPSVVNLDRGKFAFYRSQNYLLVLGGNSEVLDETLKLQLQCLYGTFRFYYRGIGDVNSFFKGEKNLFLKKMQKAWYQCLLVSQCFGSTIHLTFNAVPVATSSKTFCEIDKRHMSHINVKAKRLLQICQMNSGVLAGAIFCENLLLYSQLTPQLTKYLTFLLQYHHSDFLNDEDVSTRLPPGVKLKAVYLNQTEINNILKYNHQYAGSQFRYHCHRKFLSSSCGSVNPSCGSEGDIDSENTDEDSGRIHSNIPIKNCESVHPAAIKVKCLEDFFNFSPCNVGKQHSASAYNICLNDKKYSSILRNHKQNYVTSYFRQEIQDQSVNIVHDTLYNCSRILSRHHSMCCVANGKMKWKEFHKTIADVNDLKKIRDLNSLLDTKNKHLCNLKAWSSDLEIRNVKKVLPCFCSFKQCLLCHIKSNYIENEFYFNSQKKLQVLKCRSGKGNGKNTKKKTKACRCISYQESSGLSSFETRDKAIYSSISTTSSSSKCDYIDTPKANRISAENKDFEIQEMTLYIQQYGDCLLLLLLNDHFEEKFYDHLWMYGSSVLGGIELDSKIYLERCRKEKKNGFHIFMLNNALRELTGRPDPFHSSTEFRNSTGMTVQTMHQSFISDTSLRSISVMSRTKSIFGYNSLQHQIFYLEPGNSSLIKTETMTHHDHSASFSEKALHKIKKYFDITMNKI